MSFDTNLFDWARDALSALGSVTMRKMMGGATLYLDGTVFAILVESEIWLKSDAEADAVWDAQGCERFTYAFKDGRMETMNYRRAPLDAYDDAEAMQRWAALAVEAGRRSAAKRKPRKHREA